MNRCTRPQQMSKKRVQAIPVIDQDGQLAGVLTAGDVNEAYRLLAALS